MRRSVDPRKIYDNIDWPLLMFFVGLFLILGGAEQAGITDRLVDLASRFDLHRPVIFTLIVSGLSNVVSNVPAVILLKNVVARSADPKTAWLMLAMASTLAGNLTITGSVANIIVIEQARADVPIGFLDYLKIGVPVTLATLAVGLAWLIYFPVF
jgi:Na+/H+ antiporter NhaD/arsenite permease-like protein